MSAKLKFARPLALAGLLAVVAMPAFAADAIESVPEPVAPIDEPIATWTGGYVGLYAGYGFSGQVHEPGHKFGTDGFLGGAFGGYNYDLGNGIVVGGEGDVGYSGIEGDDAGTTSKTGVEGSLRARLGYAVTPDILPYVTAGGAAQSLKVSQPGVSDRNTMLGWTAGGGVDFKATENVFVRGEYRYTDFGTDDFEGIGEVKSKDHRVTLGVGYKF